MSPSITLGFDPDEDEEPLIGPGSAVAVAAAPPELPVVPNMIVQFEADAITGVLTGAELDSWPDQSAGAHHAGALTTARPLYFDSGGPNNMPFVRFDGINDMMTIPAAGDILTQWDDATFLAVVKSGNANATMFLQTRSTNAKGIRQTAAGNWENWNDPTADIIGVVSTTNWQIIKTQLFDTHSFAWKIGASLAWWAGDVAAILVYRPGTTAGDFNLLAAYLAAKYDL